MDHQYFLFSLLNMIEFQVINKNYKTFQHLQDKCIIMWQSHMSYNHNQ